MHVLIIFILIVSLVLCRIQSQSPRLEEGFVGQTGSTGPTISRPRIAPMSRPRIAPVQPPIAMAQPQMTEFMRLNQLEQEFRQKKKMIEAEMIKAGMTQANISEALKAMLEVYMTEAGMTEEQKKIPRAMHEFTEMQKMQTTPPSAQMQTTPPISVQAPLYNGMW